MFKGHVISKPAHCKPAQLHFRKAKKGVSRNTKKKQSIYCWYNFLYTLTNCNLSGRKEGRQRPCLHSKIITQIVMPFLRIIGRVQFQIKSCDYNANRQAYLHPCKALSGTVGWTKRKGNKGSGVVYVGLRFEDLGFQS